LRRIDRQTAIEILHCTDRYLATRVRDVKKLKPPLTGLRLKCGEYRLFFEYREATGIEILGVRHRRGAYR
jgi:mRNA-degrading endonuclease RelE of RelBE toxin-antitoxin system